MGFDPVKGIAFRKKLELLGLAEEADHNMAAVTYSLKTSPEYKLRMNT
jgi:hypothetical protein